MSRLIPYFFIFVTLLQGFFPCQAATQKIKQYPLGNSPPGGDICLSAFLNGSSSRSLQVLISEQEETILLRVYDNTVLIAGLVRPQKGHYTFYKAHLRDAVHEEIVGIGVSSNRQELSDLFILGLDDNNEIAPLPLIDECQSPCLVDPALVQNGDTILIPFTYHSNRCITLSWNSRRQLFIARVEFCSDNQLSKTPPIKERF